MAFPIVAAGFAGATGIYAGYKFGKPAEESPTMRYVGASLKVLVVVATVVLAFFFVAKKYK